MFINNAENISHIISKCYKELIRLENSILKKTGISSQQYKILELFTKEDKLTFKDIRITLEADKGSLSSTINRMQQQGLLKVETPDYDKRIKMISITSSGDNKRKAAVHIIEELNSLLKNRFTTDEYNTTVKLIERTYMFLKNQNHKRII